MEYLYGSEICLVRGNKVEEALHSEDMEVEVTGVESDVSPEDFLGYDGWASHHHAKHSMAHVNES